MDNKIERKIPKFAPYLIFCYIDYILDLGDDPRICVKVHEKSDPMLQKLAEGNEYFNFTVQEESEDTDIEIDEEGITYTMYRGTSTEVIFSFFVPLADIYSVMSPLYDINLKAGPEVEMFDLFPKLKQEKEKEDELIKRRSTFRIVK